MKKYCQQLPLSSDVFTGFGEEDSEEHELDVDKAEEIMIKQAIPSLIKELKDKLKLNKQGNTMK